MEGRGGERKEGEGTGGERKEGEGIGWDGRGGEATGRGGKEDPRAFPSCKFATTPLAAS